MVKIRFFTGKLLLVEMNCSIFLKDRFWDGFDFEFKDYFVFYLNNLENNLIYSKWIFFFKFFYIIVFYLRYLVY